MCADIKHTTLQLCNIFIWPWAAEAIGPGGPWPAHFWDPRQAVITNSHCLIAQDPCKSIIKLRCVGQCEFAIGIKTTISCIITTEWAKTQWNVPPDVFFGAYIFYKIQFRPCSLRHSPRTLSRLDRWTPLPNINPTWRFRRQYLVPLAVWVRYSKGPLSQRSTIAKFQRRKKAMVFF